MKKDSVNLDVLIFLRTV